MTEVKLEYKWNIHERCLAKNCHKIFIVVTHKKVGFSYVALLEN